MLPPQPGQPGTPPPPGGGAGAPPMPGAGAPSPQMGGSPGNEAAAVMDIKSGLMFLQRALPNLPMGTPLHTDILNAVKTISKHAQQSGEPQGPVAQNINSMARQQAANAPQIAAMRAMGGGASNPGGAPAVPQPPPPQADAA